MWLDGSYLVLIQETQHRSVFHFSSLQLEVKVLSYKPSYQHYPGRIRARSSRRSKYNIDCAYQGPQRSIPLSS